jgi:hypothetical protein
MLAKNKRKKGNAMKILPDLKGNHHGFHLCDK